MTTKQPVIHVGIDVSKDELAVAIAGAPHPQKSAQTNCMVERFDCRIEDVL